MYNNEVIMKQADISEMYAALEDKLRARFGKTGHTASDAQIFSACAEYLREQLSRGTLTENTGGRRVHYLSMEFLLGRSLEKNAFNLGVLEPLRACLERMGRDPAEIFDAEPDAGLGNGGLGRLAACCMDSCATLGLPVSAYSLCYENGMFRQVIENGCQRELADTWLDAGQSWLETQYDDTEEVRFGGKGQYPARVLAIPRDMLISGFGGGACRLRLRQARAADGPDMELFSRGKYAEALQAQTLAEVITKVLYPADSHDEGRELRLRQQYFFVSASAQSIVRAHKKRCGSIRDFDKENVIQINDTHPALMIPELMRIFLGEGLEWDEAWRIVCACTAYTNHTIMPEALEAWPQELVRRLLPELWSIITEIDRRWTAWLLRELESGEMAERERILRGGAVHMAGLCQAACFRINGVSALHGSILRTKLFKTVYEKRPERYTFITNGVDHRRWLAQCDPLLGELISSLIGEGWLRSAGELARLRAFERDGAVLQRLGEIKMENKRRLAGWVRRSGGPALDTDSVFDVHIKRLHEYKRQLLCAMLAAHLQNRIHDEPAADFLPRTFIFGAKAAPGYHMAKRVIMLLNSLAADIEGDELCRGKLRVVFLENYRVTTAERLIPAAQVSEQISCAGYETSGTGCMKLMMNGALTIGTLDGANIELYSLLGDENMFVFGLRAEELERLRRDGACPAVPHSARRVLERFSRGLADGESYSDIAYPLLHGGDRYILLADFESYVQAHERLYSVLEDSERANRASLVNIAESGAFAADRAAAQYAREIWRV